MKIVVAVLTMSLLSCGNDASNNHHKNQDSSTTLPTNHQKAKIVEPIVDEEIIVLKKNGITLTEIKPEKHPATSLHLNTKQFKEGVNTLDFSVTGSENNAIAVIENNYTISQHQTTSITKELLYGNNVFLAFLTYPNGISIKTNKAHILQNITLSDERLFDMSQPHLFYYLPQQKMEELILDFYLVNTSIAENGNKVIAIINGVEFMITKWAAYQISGIAKDKNTIRLQLVDKSGQLIDGPFNDSGERYFGIPNLENS